MEDLGHPYVWVQNLGGLPFPSDVSEVGAVMEYLSIALLCACIAGKYDRCVFTLLQGVRGGSSLSASHMENTMKLLRGRVQSRLSLHKQFTSLGMFLLLIYADPHTLNNDCRFLHIIFCFQSTA